MLTHSDLRLLKSVIECGHELETEWPTSHAETKSHVASSPQLASPIALVKLEELRLLVRSCAEATSEDLKRLAIHDRDLTIEMSARHLAGILVPFERLLGRAVRDDEFMVTTFDNPNRARDVQPLRILADNIRSSFNVGAILRTSEGFGVEHVHLTGYSPTPTDSRTAKTSLGAQDAVPWSSEPSAQTEIKKLKAEGYQIVALETAETAMDLASFNWPEKVALVLGNERFGVDADTLALADHIVRIPMYGVKNSLNVGIACGIALADWRTKLAGAKKNYAPIGVFKSQAIHPYEATRQGSVELSGEIGIIQLENGRGFEQALRDLEGFERVWIVYDFHHNPNWKPMVKPPRGPATKRGVFATRSPYRPNSIGLSAVELIKVEGLQVHVRGFDLLDGTPVLDIKPYLPYADAFPGAKAGWTETLDDAAFKIELTAEALEKVAWLEAQGLTQLRGFVSSQLEFDPLDHDRKRLSPAPKIGAHRLAYRTWRVDFDCDTKARHITVYDITSGYTSHDLEIGEDSYHDKQLHREFLAHNFKASVIKSRIKT